MLEKVSVEIKNFESWRSAKFDIEGVTVLVGPTNSGKSALVRAIQSLLSNPRGSEFVKKGAGDCSVRLVFQYSEGFTKEVKWRKQVGAGGTYSFYYKGQSKTFRKAPSDVSRRVREFLGLLPLLQIIGGLSVDLHVMPQFESGLVKAVLEGKIVKEGKGLVEQLIRQYLTPVIEEVKEEKKKLKQEVETASQVISTLESQYNTLQAQRQKFREVERYFGGKHLAQLRAEIEQRVAQARQLKEAIKLLGYMLQLERCIRDAKLALSFPPKVTFPLLNLRALSLPPRSVFMPFHVLMQIASEASRVASAKMGDIVTLTAAVQEYLNLQAFKPVKDLVEKMRKVAAAASLVERNL